MILRPRPDAFLAGRREPAGGWRGPVGSMSSAIAAAEILVEGRVQRVGYRAFAEHRALRLGLAGYVTNLPDGRVLVHAEGDEAVIKMFMDDLAEGPRGARIDRTDVKWVTPTRQFTSFDIR